MENLCIDLTGPYSSGKDKVQSVKNQSTGKQSQKVIEKAPVLHCRTMIDPATSWFEIAQIDDKSSVETANELEITWLNRQYPLPTEVVCDKGCEFMGEVIRMLHDNYNNLRGSF